MKLFFSIFLTYFGTASFVVSIIFAILKAFSVAVAGGWSWGFVASLGIISLAMIAIGQVVAWSFAKQESKKMFNGFSDLTENAYMKEIDWLNGPPENQDEPKGR